MTSKAHRYNIGSVNEFQPGRPYAIEVDGKSLVVIRKGARFYALRNRCPHQGAPLSEGHLTGCVQAREPGGEIHYDRIGEILVCPWHGWEYEVCTGRSLVNPERIRVRTYPVEVEEGCVWILLSPN